MSGSGEQYAVLLNGRLVGETPYVFESRDAVARLVLLLGYLTGARASAVQRGWLLNDAPPFDLAKVSDWLDQNASLVRRPHYSRPAEVPEVTLRELVWPPDAWGTEAPVHYSRNSQTTFFSFPPFEELPVGAEYSSFRDGPEGDLYDILKAAHDLDDWQLDEPGHTDARTLPRDWEIQKEMEYLSAPVTYRHWPDPLPATPAIEDEDTWTPAPYSAAVQVPTMRKPTGQTVRSAPTMAPTPPPKSPVELSRPAPAQAQTPLVHAYEVVWENHVLGGTAWQFESHAAALKLLRKLHGVLAEPIGLQAVTGGQVTPYAPQQFYNQLVRLPHLQFGELTEHFRQQAGLPKAVPPVVQGHIVENGDEEQTALTRPIHLDLPVVLHSTLRASYDQYEDEEDTPLDPRQERIWDIVQERRIRHLVHFTRVENLPSIIRNGLSSRAKLDASGTDFYYNDEWRADKRRGAICLSVSYPNYRMFYRYKQQNVGQEWAIILLDPWLLCQLDCGFTRTNAAAAEMSRLSDEEIREVEAFEAMFHSPSLRQRLNLPDSYTTDPQAEVLVFEGIHPSFIREIHLESYADPALTQLLQGTEVVIGQDLTYFRPRLDYAHWRSS